MNVILLPTFATRDRPQPQTHQPSRRHALGSAAPPEAVKNDSGTVQTVNAPVIWWVIRLKLSRRSANPSIVHAANRYHVEPHRVDVVHLRDVANRFPSRFRSSIPPSHSRTSHPWPSSFRSDTSRACTPSA